MGIRFTFRLDEETDGTTVCVLKNIGDNDHTLRLPNRGQVRRLGTPYLSPVSRNLGGINHDSGKDIGNVNRTLWDG